MVILHHPSQQLRWQCSSIINLFNSMPTQKYSFAKTSLPNGVTPIPPTALGAGVNSVLAKIARCTTTDPSIWASATTTVTVDLQVSYDNQVSWNEVGSITDSGGIRLDKNSAEVAFSSINASFNGQPTHVKGSITISNGPLVTSGLITVN